jgi:hypothetical protein
MFQSLFGSSKIDGLYRFHNYENAYDLAYSAAKEKENLGAVLRYAVFTDSVEDNCAVESYDDFVPLTVNDIPVLKRIGYELP